MTEPERPLRILFVEDVPTDAELAQKQLQSEKFHFTSLVVETREDFLAALQEFCPDLVISDYAMPHFDGMQALELTLQHDPLLPFIVLTGSMNEETAVQCMKAGATDYVIKEHVERLPLAVQRALQQKKLQQQKEEAEASLQESEERFRVAMKNSAIIVAHIDKELRYTWIYNTHPDFAPAAVVGKRDEEISDNEGTRQLQQLKKQVIDTGLGARKEIAFPFSDGTRFYDITVEPLRDEQGNVIGATTAALDITGRKQTENALQRRLNELEALYRVSHTLRSAETLEEMLPLLLGETLAVLEAEAGAIWLYHASSASLRFATARGWLEDLGEPSLRPDRGIIGKVFTQKEMHISPELATDPLLELCDHEQVPPGWTGVTLPILATERVVGVFTVSAPLLRTFSAEELQLLTSLAEMAGTAIHRIRLHRKTSRQLRQLQSLRAIDQAITTSLELEHTMNILLEQVISVLEVEAACVYLFYPRQNMLEYYQGKGFQSSKTRKRLASPEESCAHVALREQRLIQVDGPEDAPTANCAAILEQESFQGCAAVPLMVKGETKGVLEVFYLKTAALGADWLDFLQTLAAQAAIAIDNARLFEDLQHSNLELYLAYDATLEGWARALELRDKETEGHSQRVAEITLRIAKNLGMEEEKMLHIRRGALLHDIGKLGIPDTILHKPGKLTAEEWSIMHRHPQYAFDMLFQIDYLRPAMEIPYCHHEKWDGSGYPRGLQGEQIPLEARIFSVVDVYDALTSDRPYRKAWSREEALAYIQRESGTHFDPRVVEAFMKEIN